MQFLILLTKPIFVWAFLVKLNRRWRKFFLLFLSLLFGADVL